MYKDKTISTMKWNVKAWNASIYMKANIWKILPRKNKQTQIAWSCKQTDLANMLEMQCYFLARKK